MKRILFSLFLFFLPVLALADPIIGGTSSAPSVNFNAGTPNAITTTLQTTTAETNSIDRYSTIAGAFSDLAATGGGTMNIPYGSNVITTPLNLTTGLNLVGVGEVDVSDSSSPHHLGSSFRAGANMAAVLTQASLTSVQQSVGLRYIELDGCMGITPECPSAFTTTNVANFAIASSVIDHSSIQNGSGNCLSISPGSSAAWINTVTFDKIGGCSSGDGVYFSGSDSLFEGDYISGNSVGFLGNSTGFRFIGNQVEVSGTDGLELENPLSVGFPGMSVSVMGTYFNLNTNYDVHVMVGAGSVNNFESTIVGDLFHSSSGVGIDNNVTSGLIAGSSFGSITNTAGCDIVFNANSGGSQSNGGWQVIGTNHKDSTSVRFCNLPPDTQFITGGNGGAWNRLMNLSLGSGAPLPQATFEDYGGNSVLGDSSVVARFGLARNTSTFDAALLVGSVNGNTPFLDAVNGETTNAAGFQLRFQGTTVATLNAGTFTIHSSSVLGLPLATWTDTQTCTTGQISIDASFIYVCTATNTVKRATLATF